MEVLQDLDLVTAKTCKISGLSGGQQKPVSIGVELNHPAGLFFLDEPSPGWTGHRVGLMNLLRKLADQGRTIILITHATKNVMLADKVILPGPGRLRGLVPARPPERALRYFDGFRSGARAPRPPDGLRRDLRPSWTTPSGGKAEDGPNATRNTRYREYILQP